VVWARELRRLSLAVVGCAELRELSFKWCLGVSDLGIHILGSRAPVLRCGSRKGNGEERARSERELGVVQVSKHVLSLRFASDFRHNMSSNRMFSFLRSCERTILPLESILCFPP
jgi:hypothetical protein